MVGFSITVENEVRSDCTPGQRITLVAPEGGFLTMHETGASAVAAFTGAVGMLHAMGVAYGLE